ncbi:MAG TPA: hypothetical protein DCY89_07550, partial [Gammaproteobacteria bacterium]|nr:hypothetical protein [Gammaproteobacteria bacterium]
MVTHDLSCISDRVQRVACVNRRLWCHHPAEIDGFVIDRLYRHPSRGSGSVPASVPAQPQPQP